MTVLAYQIFIVASLIVARLFGGKALLVGALIWSGLSIANVFFPPLIALQLAVVWVTFSLLTPKDRSATSDEKISSVRPIRADLRSPISPKDSSKHENAVTSFVDLDQCEVWGADERVLDPAVGGPLLKQRAMYDLERALIAYFMGRAEGAQKHQSFFQMADAKTRENYILEERRRAPQASLSAQSVRRYSEFDYKNNLPPAASSPTLSTLLGDRWNRAKADHDSFISELSGKLNTDPMLRMSFMDSALLNEAGSLLSRLNLEPFDGLTASDRINSWFTESADIPAASWLGPSAVLVESPTDFFDQNGTAASSDAWAIRQIAIERKLPQLVHFTAISNLVSILKHGIVPLSEVEASGIKSTVNDILRLDSRRHATSTSIAFPNASMFWKYRQENPSAGWVVLGIDPSIIWTRQCYFCKHNAADRRISRLPAEGLMTPKAFAEMFDELDGELTRDRQNLMPFDPTDPQAEVMVLGVIPPEMITTIVFNDPALAAEYSSAVEGRLVQVHDKARGLFSQRSYERLRRDPH